MSRRHFWITSYLHWKWNHREGLVGTLNDYWCYICQSTAQPDLLLAIYESAKQELEVPWTWEEDPGQPLQLARQGGSPEAPPGGGSWDQPWTSRGAARGRKDSVTPARVVFREDVEEEEGGEELEEGDEHQGHPDSCPALAC